MLGPHHPDYASRLAVYNSRTALAPALFAVCDTTKAIGEVITWVRDKAVDFAVRSGGHSYEGFSNSPGVVIDLKNLNRVTFVRTSKTVTVGAGATLRDVQSALRTTGYALAAGTCPSVGLSGHVLGGGYGFLARKYGLAIDSLKSIRMVDASGRLVFADKTINPDLFWASRGGGGGSFGVATEFVLQVHPVPSVAVFGLSWALPQDRAARVVDAWQRWAPTADNGITALLNISRKDDRTIALQCRGQSLAKLAVLESGLRSLEAIEPPLSPHSIQQQSFWDAFLHFAGKQGDPKYQKEKSDFISSLSEAGIDTLLAQILGQTSNQIAVIFNAYGGAINALSEQETAFPHRKSVKFMMHYYSGWESSSATAERAGRMRSVYNAMRPHVPGKAYVNYCDSDLVNWPAAYWGQNLNRLKQVKRAVDSNNLFHFKQSIPLV